MPICNVSMLLMFTLKRVIREALATVDPVHRWPVGLRRKLLGGG